MVPTDPPSRPPFSSLPLDPSGPAGNAWGLYGPEDALGALNMLTPAVVAAAATEIKTGERVSLDWHLNKPSHPSFGRSPFEWKLVNRSKPDGEKRTVNDDVLTFNTQCSSQWDGFRHYGYQKAKRYYNGHVQEELDDPNVIGIDAWVSAGGITTRGILLDYPRFCTAHSLTLSPLTSTSIPFAHIQAMLAETHTVPRAGDILLLRSGFTLAYESLPPDDQNALATRPSPDFIGLEPSLAVLRWIWESGFCAVASDAPSFERAPIAGPHTAAGGVWKGESFEEEMQGGGLLHQWLLAGWGVPIGELFDLEELGRVCAEKGRWSFFVASVPLKVPGGVASPPNAVAIF
ncbi:uncharacterized protein BDZ99DRAFT_62128 [Mytilinidion resinicola]|uniref:Cyclase n=1 Tax=Mytilinidion resinicola TaxID=574789 RepID=A0A6A6YGF3_9PEZI|nr:uncharacterized protein BDZ99DRAFT_62128 [Mytilinidion resinicola]KAF2807658.1 hypothetical protein BDZ99DRAFT_62128 [Mytilinidion resinicola]